MVGALSPAIPGVDQLLMLGMVITSLRTGILYTGYISPLTVGFYDPPLYENSGTSDP